MTRRLASEGAQRAGAYTKAWTASWNILFHPGMEPLEYICQENNVDIRQLVGK
jgi:hypothetical protein